MIDELRQRVQALQRPPEIEDDPGVVLLGMAAIDAVLGGGLARGVLHEIAAAGEPHLPAAAGFAAAVAGLASVAVLPGRPQTRNDARGNKSVVWIAEDMALAESGALYGPGLEAFGLTPERLVTVAAAHRRDLLWAMEEALRCRALSAVIGEVRGGAIDTVAVRRLSLAATESGALALLLRTAPAGDTSTAATRWIVGAAPSFLPSPGWGGSPSEARRGGVTSENTPPPGDFSERNIRFTAQLVRNRRGPAGSWIIEWSDSDERFILATHAQPVPAPALDRPHRQVA